MVPLPHDADVRLDAGQLFALSTDAVHTVEVLDGSIWITQDGQEEDIVLSAGARVVLPHPDAAIISALGGPAVVHTHLAADFALAA